MKVILMEDEVFTIGVYLPAISNANSTVDIPDELYEEYVFAMTRFQKVQDKLAQYMGLE